MIKQHMKEQFVKWDRLLRKNGAYYWFPWLSAKRYLMLRIGTGLVCGLCGYGIFCLMEADVSMRVLAYLAGVIFGYFLPMIGFSLSDKRDNEQMISDVRKLYEYIKIQVKAGMYLTNSLSACYLAISNRRLKQGLLELNSRLIATNSVPIAMGEFEEKFTNEYIGYFCMIVSQSEQSGRMAQMLEDMSKQIVDMQRYMLTQKKGRIERKVIFLTLLVFVGILLIAAYQLAVSLMGSIVGMLG